jgi:ABC-2 type transport system permease protein
MLQALYKAFWYEIHSIGNSWYKLFLISLFPLLSFVLIIAIFRTGVVRDLPLAVVDRDHSQLSRMILRAIDASPSVEVAYRVNSLKEAVKLTRQSRSYGIIVIPENFSRDVFLRKHPSLTAMINTQYILVGKILTSALTSTIMYQATKLEYLKNLANTPNSDLALHAASPIGIQITPFFNRYQNYFYFLVSALLPAVWQIFIVIATLVSVGTLFKYKREKVFFGEGRFLAFRLLGLMLPYTLAFMLLGMLYLFYLYSLWEFQGSFAVMIFGMFLTVVAYQVIALFLFALGFDYVRSLSLGAVYTAPAFAFLGVTFPLYNMNGFALFWREILPVSHYTELQISQANYGANVFLETGKLGTLLAFWLLFIPVLFLFGKRVAKRSA